MRGFNQATIIGHLGNDVDVKYMQDGTAVASLSVATSEEWKDKDGEKKSRTEWHTVKLFGKIAEVCGEYLHKGSAVFVQGVIRYRKHTGTDGVDRYYTDIRVDSKGTIQFLDKAPGGERTERQAPPRREVPAAAKAEFADDFADDDIPF